MNSLQLRSRIASDGKLTLQLPAELANQDLDLIIVYQASIQPLPPAIVGSEDPLIGLFSGTPTLATEAESILHQTITPQSGLTWKPSSPTPASSSPS
jgi:hypothetical protein